MMQVLEPTYTIRIEIRDIIAGQVIFGPGGGVMGQALNHQGLSHPAPKRKFFDANNNKTGCDEVLSAVKKALADAGLAGVVTLERFEHK